MDSYQALLLLTLSENTDISDMGGTYVGLFNNWHLVTAPSTYVKKFKWQNTKLKINTTVDNGYNNSYNVKNLDNHPAINYCINFTFNKFNDYYLPSIYELRFINKKTSILENNFYWSSTEYNDSEVYSYTDSLISTKDKYSEAFVLPVRRLLLE